MYKIRAFARVAFLLIIGGQAHAAFTKIADIPLTTDNHHGIAFDGENWHIAGFSDPSFYTYEADFTFIDETTVPGVGSIRGLTFDSNSGNLFLGSNSSSTVYEVTTAGSIVQQFVAGSGNLNALAFDPVSDTVWLARFGGEIEQYGRTGGLISSFMTGDGLLWTGLAVDTCSGNLLLLETGDLAYEYQTDGTLVGQIIASDLIDANGQGFYYDPATAELYATSQSGDIALFQDSSRRTCGSGSIAIPASAPLGLLLLVLMMAGLALVSNRLVR